MSYKDRTWCGLKDCKKFEKCKYAYNKKQSELNKNNDMVQIQWFGLLPCKKVIIE